MRKSAVDVVGVERAADASFLPAGAEHEMLDDKLAACAEEVGQRFLAVRPLEDIRFVDLYPRQFTPRRAYFIPAAGQFLLFDQVLLVRVDRLGSGDDPVVHHLSTSIGLAFCRVVTSSGRAAVARALVAAVIMKLLS